jgi:hypothetical protein
MSLARRNDGYTRSIGKNQGKLDSRWLDIQALFRKCHLKCCDRSLRCEQAHAHDVLLPSHARRHSPWLCCHGSTHGLLLFPDLELPHQTPQLLRHLGQLVRRLLRLLRARRRPLRRLRHSSDIVRDLSRTLRRIRHIPG